MRNVPLHAGKAREGWRVKRRGGVGLSVPKSFAKSHLPCLSLEHWQHICAENHSLSEVGWGRVGWGGRGGIFCLQTSHSNFLGPLPILSLQTCRPAPPILYLQTSPSHFRSADQPLPFYICRPAPPILYLQTSPSLFISANQPLPYPDGSLLAHHGIWEIWRLGWSWVPPVEVGSAQQ